MSRGRLATYQEFPLNLERKACRILRLLPGIERQQLHGELDTVDFNDPTREPYSCISYVWGDTNITGPMRINDEELQVTTNLLSCLHHLRHPQDAIVLWIDAVCINQDDLSEKSHQVSIMGEIYSQCSTVYVWLGCPPDMKPLAQDPFTLIRHFAEYGHYCEGRSVTKGDPGTVSFPESETFLAVWKNFLHVVDSKWWTRSWTVQEVVLPKNAIAMYGHWTISFDAFNVARDNRGYYTSDLGVYPQRKTLDRFFLQVEFVVRLRLQHLEKHNLSSSDNLHWTGPLPHHSFYEAVEMFSSRNCHNPRDKVFSLLATATSSAFETFKPDYRAPAPECYTEVFGRMISETAYDYRCLLGTAFGTGLPGLPSWVRDFSHILSLDVVEQELRRIQTYPIFNASGRKTGKMQVQNKNELHVTGVLADVVKDVGRHVGDVHDPVSLRSVFDEWIKLCEKAIGSTDKTAVRKALSRVTCPTVTEEWRVWVELGLGWRRVDEADNPGETEWQQLLNGDPMALEGRRQSGTIMAITGRSLFVTQTGKLGLCDPKVKTGDGVWVLFGSNVPFMLRKMAQTCHSRGSHTFAGDCFLDGAMGGEIVPSAEEGKSLIII